MKLQNVSKAVLLGAVFFSQLALAAGDVDPKCISNGQELVVNNSDVIHWKKSTANQFLARAHVQGVIGSIYPDKSGHKHFQILLDQGAGETLEIVYNLSFGALPNLKAGMTVEACGDYITSNAATSAYPASPDGAILHWVHSGGSVALPMDAAENEIALENDLMMSASTKHDSGYLEINDVVYGEKGGVPPAPVRDSLDSEDGYY